MKHRYLEVTFRRGKPIAAYLYLERATQVNVARTVQADPGLQVDYDVQDIPVGIEITAPTLISLSQMNTLLGRLGAAALAADEFAPLRTA